MRIAKTLAPVLVGLGVLAVPAAAHDYTVGDIRIDHLYAREMPPGAPAGGGYMTIRNGGDAADRLVAVEAAGIGRTELHEMTMEGDVMRMRPLADGIALPAGGTVELAPGGYHVMFLDVDDPFAAGDRIEATLRFENAGEVEVEFVVESMDAGDGHGHDHDHREGG